MATGFVVDDAVVVLENIKRHVEAGMAPFPAALRGAREVGFTVVAMSASLIAVFIPILFMPGLTGRLFREFAVTLAAAIAVSLVVSLTDHADAGLALIARARRRPAPRSGALGRTALRSSAQTATGSSLDWSLDHGRIIGAVLLATVILNVVLYIYHSEELPAAAGHRSPGRQCPGRPELFVPGHE